MALTSVLCYYMTSFNYDGKKAKDVGITCRCHLSNILTDSIFYDSMGWEINCFLFVCLFCEGDNHCLLVLCKECCRTCQYNLLDRMFKHDFNKTLNQSYAIIITLVSIPYQNRGSVSPIYPFLE